MNPIMWWIGGLAMASGFATLWLYWLNPPGFDHDRAE